MLVDCEEEFDEFITRMDLLDDKLGPLLLQFRISTTTRSRAPMNSSPVCASF
ncbi:MAG: hypothetical protein DMG50_13465 [Acidobacteria bacterium]|nr:MAG: hypothetical protein DMG50_13465 [Acidobacteriota bacterium]